MDLQRAKSYLKTRGFDDHGRFRGHRGECLLVASKRGNWDYADKECRDFVGIRLIDSEAEWVRYRFSISRSALAGKNFKRINSDLETFLIQAGLLRFKRFLLNDDSPGRTGDFMIHSKSDVHEYLISAPNELRAEVSRVKYQLLDLLWQNHHMGIKRTLRKDIEDALCTTDAILDSVINTFEKRKFITGGYGSAGMKITAEGEIEMERLQPINIAPVKRDSSEDSTLNAGYDLFISHASEDKDAFVRPLAEALKQKDLNVWYDEFTLKLGDSLRESIDRGLSNSQYGVVVLSHHFFSKNWPQRELNALFSVIDSGERGLLPIWHEITAEEVKKYSPMLSDIIAAKSSDGVEKVVDMIFEVCTIK